MLAAFLPLAACGATVRDTVGFEQNIGAQLPLDAEFRDAAGARVALGELVRERPAVLMFGYFECPQLCGVTANGVIEALRQIRPTIGREFDLIYISIDPADTTEAARTAKDRDRRRYGRGDAADGWHFLTSDRATIARTAEAAGFRFRPVSGARVFAHPSGFIVVRPGGVIAQYFPGIDFRSREVAAAIGDAAAGKNGNPVFDLLLVCFPGASRSAVAAWSFRALQFGGGLAVFGLAVGVGRMLRQERRARRASSTTQEVAS